MLLELIFVAAFALFAVFAWMAITDFRRSVREGWREARHQGQYARHMEDECLRLAIKHNELQREVEIRSCNQAGLAADNHRLREQLYGQQAFSRD